MASMTHRIVSLLTGGCALVLGAGLSGCAASGSQYTGVSGPAGNVQFTVPSEWHQISARRWRPS